MVLFFILITTEILTLIVISHHFYDKSWMQYYFIFILNTVLSIWLWILWFEAVSYDGIFDTADHHLVVYESYRDGVCSGCSKDSSDHLSFHRLVFRKKTGSS